MADLNNDEQDLIEGMIRDYSAAWKAIKGHPLTYEQAKAKVEAVLAEDVYFEGDDTQHIIDDELARGDKPCE